MLIDVHNILIKSFDVLMEIDLFVGCHTEHLLFIAHG
jgi:hypothetical protein